MMGNMETSKCRFPLPMSFGLKCHPTGVVARDSGGIRSLGGFALDERPSCSSSAEQGVFYTVKEAVVFEGHVFDEDLHPCNESFRHGRSCEQPQGLDAVSEHGEEGEPSNGVPVSNAEIFYAGCLLPAANAFLAASLGSSGSVSRAMTRPLRVMCTSSPVTTRSRYSGRHRRNSVTLTLVMNLLLHTAYVQYVQSRCTDALGFLSGSRADEINSVNKEREAVAFFWETETCPSGVVCAV